ncbi:MAG: nucleotidyltransferase family protein [Cyanophyceae cyanobacterium]
MDPAPSQTTFGISDWILPHRDAILAISKKHGAFNIRIFGSVARNQAGSTSDIDILVDYDLDKITPWFPGGLKRDLQDLLQRDVDIALADSIHPLLREEIISEAVSL